MSTTAPSLTDHTIAVWNDQIALHFKVLGAGSPIVYLHPAGGLALDPFLTALSEQHTIYAPEIPGTTPGDPHAIHQIDDLRTAARDAAEAARPEARSPEHLRNRTGVPA
jgi:hypothetical protein